MATPGHRESSNRQQAPAAGSNHGAHRQSKDNAVPFETGAVSRLRLPAQACYFKGAIMPFVSFWRGLTVML